MSAEALKVSDTCRECGQKLTLDEMHYYDNGDGTATCNDCEGEWMEQVDAWKRGEIKDFPYRD